MQFTGRRVWKEIVLKDVLPVAIQPSGAGIDQEMECGIGV